ncbi:hypothetical protein [Pectinatus haikarae]|uniref:Uncharacterized protein n=1 Tax=Pectinatus haikarae TaxID=349096 RepID=A0ABT9Y8C4_9FIRM|nr:hypothetical protein [Pectinatus haikarae]MDQ0204081.1 hypothetical protein [Pectinatus haikarae]
MEDKKLNINEYILHIFINIIYVFIILGPGMYFGYKNQSTEMITSIVGGAIAVAFLNFDKIAEISGLGFKVKRVEKIIDDADNAVEKLKNLAALYINITSKTFLYHGIVDGIPDRDREDIIRDLETIITEFEVNDSNVKRTLYECKYSLGCYLYNELIGIVDDFAVKNALRKLGTNRHTRNYGNAKLEDLIRPEEITDKLNHYPVNLNDQEKKAFEKYKNYISHIQ